MQLASLRRLPSRAAALVVAVATGACAPLTVFNTLAPADTDAVLLAADVSYGKLARQKLDVFAPQQRTGKLPVVVVFYGGGWSSGQKDDYAFLGKAIAARGFIVLVADYRLVPDVRFPAFLEDGARAVAWAHDHATEYSGDADRLFVFGHSAGAYNAVMVALDRHYLAAIGSDAKIIKGVAALAGPYEFLPLDVGSTIAAFGRAKNLDDTQPINFVSAAAPPMFLATGDEDTTVKPSNSQHLASKLTAAGGKATVKVYAGVGHVGIMLSLSRTFRGRAPVLDDVTGFFKHLR
jgi:acetyl esterase/lipase